MKIPVLLMARELEAGGSERQMTEIALGLDRSRFEPYVGTFHPDGLRGQQLSAAGVPVIHFPVYSFRSRAALAGAWRLARFIRSRGIRLVHTFDAPLTVYATPVVRYLTPAVMLSSQRGRREITPEYHKLLRWTDPRVHGIVVNCLYMQQHLIEDEHVAEPRIRLCYNGVDLDQFYPAPASRPSSVPANALLMGTVCGLRHEKGLTTLIDAFARIRPLRPQMKLVMVGSGLELQSLQERARQAGVFDDCVWQPATPAVAGWLRSFDIFVLPSISEALSNSIMEAMACRCPVIASNVGGNPELVEHGVRGLLFESTNSAALAESLEKLIEDEPLRRNLAEAGERFIREKFSRQASAARMGEIYESFLKT